MLKIFSVVTLSSFVVIAACSKSDDSTSAPAAGSDLNGTWASGCFGPDRGMYAKRTITYSNLALTGKYEEYSDAACATKVHSTVWTGTSTIPTAAVNGITPINVSFASFKSTALTEGNAAQNNQYVYCGMSDWSANAEKDILGKACDGYSIPVNGKQYDIYKVDGSSLCFGKSAEAPSATPDESKRPTELETGYNWLTKQ